MSHLLRRLYDVDAMGQCSNLRLLCNSHPYRFSPDPSSRPGPFVISNKSHRVDEKVSHKRLSISSPILTDFQNFFTGTFCGKFVIKWLV